jgi:hypothetical protein
MIMATFWLCVLVDNHTSAGSGLIDALTPVLYPSLLIVAPLICVWGGVRALAALIRGRVSKRQTWISMVANLAMLAAWAFTTGSLRGL